MILQYLTVNNIFFVIKRMEVKKFIINISSNKLIYKIYKIIILIIIILYLYIISNNLYNNYFKLNNLYENSLNKTINIGIFANSLKNGGAERSTSLICYYFNKVKIFKLFVFTLENKQNNEFYLDDNIERLILIKQKLIYCFINYMIIVKYMN